MSSQSAKYSNFIVQHSSPISFDNATELIKYNAVQLARIKKVNYSSTRTATCVWYNCN